MILHCIQTTEPACPWVGGTERDLIWHYIAEHYPVKAADYVALSDALQRTRRELEMYQTQLARVGLSV